MVQPQLVRDLDEVVAVINADVDTGSDTTSKIKQFRILNRCKKYENIFIALFLSEVRV